MRLVKLLPDLKICVLSRYTLDRMDLKDNFFLLFNIFATQQLCFFKVVSKRQFL